MTRGEILAILSTTPDRVANLAGGLSAAALARRPTEGEWYILHPQ